MDRKPRVLFLCTGNSARSQMAEALLRHHAGDRFEACSAGMQPKDFVNPFTLRVLNEIGIDTSTLHPKHTREFLGKASVVYAIPVCNRAEEACPRLFPFALHTLNWPIDDPAAAIGTDEERLNVFRTTRDTIDARVRQFLREEGR